VKIKEGKMGYKVKVQKVVRPASRSYYVNLPLVLAETIGVEKGDEFEWSLADVETLMLKRVGGKSGRGKEMKMARKGKPS
jgi:hypothetical protein